MEDKNITQNKKTILHQVKIAEERFENASFILEREVNEDAIPILFKTVDVIVRILLSFRQKQLDNFQKNIKAMEEEYKEEGLWEKGAVELFLSLYEMNEKYKSEQEPEFDKSDVKNVFEKAENFLVKTHKFLKNQSMTPREKRIQDRIRKILAISGASIGALIIIFFLIKLGINKFGPAHGLLAHYYDNIDLKEPAAVERVNKDIDFVWADLSPYKNISGEFSVRWQGRIKINQDDNYTFTISTDEGARLFIDDKMVIDTWTQENRALEHSGSIDLEEGFHKIKVEYYFNQNYADIKLLWSSPTSKRKIVKTKYFYPPPEYKKATD